MLNSFEGIYMLSIPEPKTTAQQPFEPAESGTPFRIRANQIFIVLTVPDTWVGIVTYLPAATCYQEIQPPVMRHNTVSDA